MYRYKFKKYRNKVNLLNKMIGGGLCKCGRVAHPTHGTCCRACQNNVGQHTQACDNYVMCSKGCGRNANVNTTTNDYFAGHLCCPNCPNHTPACYARNLQQVPQPPPQKQPMIKIIGHPKLGDKSVLVDVIDFKYENLRLPHVEILNPQSPNVNLLPNINSQFTVGIAKLGGRDNSAIMRIINNLLREDGKPAHITVYYGADAQQRLNEFK